MGGSEIEEAEARPPEGIFRPRYRDLADNWQGFQVAAAADGGILALAVRAAECEPPRPTSLDDLQAGSEARQGALVPRQGKQAGPCFGG